MDAYIGDRQTHCLTNIFLNQGIPRPIRTANIGMGEFQGPIILKEDHALDILSYKIWYMPHCLKSRKQNTGYGFRAKIYFFLYFKLRDIKSSLKLKFLILSEHRVMSSILCCIRYFCTSWFCVDGVYEPEYCRPDHKLRHKSNQSCAVLIADFPSNVCAFMR